MQTREQGASRARWRHNRLLLGLEAVHLDALGSCIQSKHLHDGEVLYTEGDAADALWLIGQGEVRMLRLIDGQSHTLDRMRRDDFVGEAEWLKGRPRRATAYCHGEVLAWSIDRQGLQRYHMLTGQDLLTQCIANQTAALSERLDKAELQQLTALRQGLQEAQLRSAFGTLLTHLILLIFVYTSALGGLQHLAQQQAATTWVTSAALLVMVAVAIWTVRQTGFPARVFGWSLQGWRRDLLDACYWSLWACGIITAVKGLLIYTVPAYADLPLLAPWQARSGDWLDTLVAYALYVLLSPLQEFVARGVIQGCLQHMLSGRHATWRAILVSNAVFSISHQHLGLGYALLVFVPGLFWGWLYQRHHSLVGVSVSHVLIGLWVTGMLDLSALVQR
jgi:CRP-like cAMP-binding protein